MSMPEDPAGSLDGMCTAIHEWFMSYRRSGFRRSEALVLTVVHLVFILRQSDEHGD